MAGMHWSATVLDSACTVYREPVSMRTNSRARQCSSRGRHCCPSARVHPWGQQSWVAVLVWPGAGGAFVALLTYGAGHESKSAVATTVLTVSATVYATVTASLRPEPG